MAPASILQPPRVYGDPGIYDWVQKYLTVNVHPERKFYVHASDGNDNNDGKSWDAPFATIQVGVNACAGSLGEYIFIGPGEYAENVTIAKADLTLQGVGARGRPWINPASGSGMQITADDVVLINLGIAGAAGAGYALNLNAASECRLYECKIEGSSDVLLLLDGTATAQVGNLMLFDCEFAWGLVGVEFDNSGFGFPTQILMRNCWFHEVTTAHVRNNATGGGVADLWMEDCKHFNSEDGTEPTDYIVVDRVGDTGMILRPYFDTDTLDSAKVTLAAGIRIVNWWTQQESHANNNGTSGRPD